MADAGFAGGSGISGIRAVSFFSPGRVKSGAALTGGGAPGHGSGVETFAGGSGEKTGGGGGDGAEGGLGETDGAVGELRGALFDGGRGGNWIRTVSRDCVFAPDAFATGFGGKASPTFSFFCSFGSAIRRGKSMSKHRSKLPRCHSPSSFMGPIWLRREFRQADRIHGFQ